MSLASMLHRATQIVLILIILEVLYEYSLLESICKMYETVLILIILEVLYELKIQIVMKDILMS